MRKYSALKSILVWLCTATFVTATAVLPTTILADPANPTAYEVMLELRNAAINECAQNGPSCKAFTDIQRQLGEYIEASCKALALTSDECARSPIAALLNQPAPTVTPSPDRESS